MRHRNRFAELFLCTLAAAGVLCLSGCGGSEAPAGGGTSAAGSETGERPASETGEAPAAQGSGGEEEASFEGTDAASGEGAEDADIAALLDAEIGGSVVTGMNAYGADNWYKFDEDEDYVYLLYGDYYNVTWRNLMDLEKAGLIMSGDYGLGTEDRSGTDSENLLDYLLNEDYWSGMRSSFENVYPQRTVIVKGGPTKEQIEKVMDDHGEAVDMLRPHQEKYEGCLGYWLATEAGSGELYEYNCVLVDGGIESSWTSNCEAIRPLVAISKRLREKTAEELLEEKMEAEVSEANQQENGADALTVGEHTLKYGKYTYTYDYGAVVSYEIRQDGTFEYTSTNSPGAETGTYQFDTPEAGGEEMRLLFIFDDSRGGVDWMTVPEDNVMESGSNRYVYSEE